MPNNYPGPRANRPVYGGAPAPGRPYPGPRPAGRPMPAEPVPVKKNRKKEKDYFYIMRRGVCFFIMLLAIVWIAVIALSFLKVLPKFTSFLVQPDRTALSLREDKDTGKVDEEGNPVLEEYVDKSVFIGLNDLIYGAIHKVAKKSFVDADGNSKSPFYDSIMEEIDKINGAASEESTEESAETTPAAGPLIVEENEGPKFAGEETSAETTTEATEESATTPTADNRHENVAGDSMFKIGTMAFTYYPLALIAGAIVALITFLLALFALFGRRIFRGFAIMSLILLVVGVFGLFAGLAGSGIVEGNPKKTEEDAVVSIIDFSKIGEFMTGSFTPPPVEPPEEEVVGQLKAVGGVPVLALAGIPVLMLLLSFFAKKKVPYSIFDR